MFNPVLIEQAHWEGTRSRWSGSLQWYSYWGITQQGKWWGGVGATWYEDSEPFHILSITTDKDSNMAVNVIMILVRNTPTSSLYCRYLHRTEQTMREQADVFEDTSFFLNFFFSERMIYKCFSFYWIFFQKKVPSTMNFSYQKYINGSMSTQREKTHIQYPNIYRLYVSCKLANSLYTQGRFCFFVPAETTTV